jgi:hypothetical protein
MAGRVVKVPVPKRLEKQTMTKALREQTRKRKAKAKQ